MSTFTFTVKSQVKCGIMFVKVKKNIRKKIQYFLENYNLTPLDMYNELSQVYCIKPEGRIH